MPVSFLSSNVFPSFQFRVANPSIIVQSYTNKLRIIMQKYVIKSTRLLLDGWGIMPCFQFFQSCIFCSSLFPAFSRQILANCPLFIDLPAAFRCCLSSEDTHTTMQAAYARYFAWERQIVLFELFSIFTLCFAT